MQKFIRRNARFALSFGDFECRGSAMASSLNGRIGRIDRSAMSRGADGLFFARVVERVLSEAGAVHCLAGRGRRSARAELTMVDVVHIYSTTLAP